MREEPPELAGPTPSRARIYDYFLGGTENYAIDREFAEEADRVFPAMRQLCRDHRRFSRAVVRHLADSGFDQFLELGSGLPTVDHVHAVAARSVADPRVVYVDRVPETVEHAARLVADEPGVAVECADATDVAAVLASPGVTALIDLDRPVAVLAVALLHSSTDDVARATVQGYRRALAPGSVIALSHPTGLAHPGLRAWCDIRHSGYSYAPLLRDPDDMASWFEGMELIGPGWVSAPEWTPDGPAPGAEVTGSGLWGVVARVP
ncbi:SAM-dependent methyltransferase [Actinomycetospora lemnae]|uniref:SAM-dependent methyltransferase n=1 Tax=Actinomycetospora lemnae TaxID=3019891 RepID=A0ABT5SUG9_9PSEU|nr:SAM-dependent methyltransferase [Actinomycetospora sp. DW7H6]MDD7966505.1 SAM-dependent methyltransferase [Actinomycetospora sp. DW7H6]